MPGENDQSAVLKNLALSLADGANQLHSKKKCAKGKPNTVYSGQWLQYLTDLTEWFQNTWVQRASPFHTLEPLINPA